MADAALTLLIAIPATLEEFLQAVTGRRDYVHRYANDPGEHWMRQGGYRESVAEPMQALAALASQIGAHVVPDARLADLTDATSTSSVVVLLGHWKGALVSSSDVSGANPGALASRLATHADPELRKLAKWLQILREGKRDELAPLMNAALSRMKENRLRAARRSKGLSRFSIHPETAHARARQTLDLALGGLLRPGEHLELADGLHAPAEIERAIAPGYSGVLDLTTCRSMILADELDRLRGGVMRCVQFEQLLPPNIAALALRQTLATLRSTEPFNYLETRAAAIRAVAQAIETKAAEQMRGRRWFRRSDRLAN